MTLSAILRRAGKHLDQIIVQAIVKLALECPFELGMVKIAGMHFEAVGVHRDGRIFEVDEDFNCVTFFLGLKVEERMFVET